MGCTYHVKGCSVSSSDANWALNTHIGHSQILSMPKDSGLYHPTVLCGFGLDCLVTYFILYYDDFSGRIWAAAAVVPLI